MYITCMQTHVFKSCCSILSCYSRMMQFNMSLPHRHLTNPWSSPFEFHVAKGAWPHATWKDRTGSRRKVGVFPESSLGQTLPLDDFVVLTDDASYLGRWLPVLFRVSPALDITNRLHTTLSYLVADCGTHCNSSCNIISNSATRQKGSRTKW